MIVDLHNHTALCNHAEGSIEAYVLKAIEKKIDIFGFSDHAPMHFDEAYRMRFDEMQTYEENVLHVKEKYADKLSILLAYEVDFLNGFMLDEILNANVDYLIGSVHFLQNKNEMWGFDNPEFIGVYKSVDIDKIWEDYFDAIKAMAKTNYFQIVGHLDLIKVFKFLPKKDVRLIAKNALKQIKKSNMILELNPAGLRKPIEETYPSKALLEEAFDLGINITFGSDAHSVEHVGFGYSEISSLAKELGYTKCATFYKKEMNLIEF